MKDQDLDALAKLYEALAHDELAARCVAKDRALRSLREQLETANARVRFLEDRIAINRARI